MTALHEAAGDVGCLLPGFRCMHDTFMLRVCLPNHVPCCRAWNQHWLFWVADILGGAAAAILYSKILLPKDA